MVADEVPPEAEQGSNGRAPRAPRPPQSFWVRRNAASEPPFRHRGYPADLRRAGEAAEARTMRIRRFVLVALFAIVLAPFARGSVPAAQAQIGASSIPYAVASESYFRVDTESGRVTARIQAEYQNQQAKELATLPVYFLPGAENIVVKAGDQVLETKLTAPMEAEGRAGNAEATLPAPLKQNFRIKLEATYDIPPRAGAGYVRLEAGLVETVFIGQGPGSFVLIDVPETGDNYFDPGCLVAASQPKEVKAEGFVRWVCGEVTIIAVNSDDPDVVRRCAAMDDSCRQRANVAVFSAYGQSITDMTKAGKLEAPVTMPDGRSVTLVLKYFKKDQAWADKQWAIAQQAFPKLEALFGWPYPTDKMTMRQSHHIEILGAAGIAFPTLGEVLLSTDTGFDEEVTIHELAHSWAGFNLDTKWLWEGLAEYGTRALAGELGVTPIDRGWERMPFKEPLATWYNGSQIYNSNYWYGKSGAFWFAYEAAVGGREVMTQVLARMDDEPGLLPLQAGWFMDQGEFISGKNLDALYLEWVFQPVTAKPLLETRRATHDQVRELQARALTMGLTGMPSDIYDNLIAWVFAPVSGQVVKANKVLDAYAEVLALSGEAGLGTPDGVAKVWGNKKVSESLVVVEEQRQAILAITNAAKDLADEPEGSTALKKLAEAKEKYALADYSGAKAAAADGVTAAFNEVTAVKMIEIAKKKQDEFSPNFFGRIGMFRADPAGDLAAAEQALADGDGTRALQLSRQAYETWDGATQAGIQRLAIVAGLMCALTFGVWYILKKLDSPDEPVKKPGQGHFLEESTERRSSWRDWENTQ